MSIKCVGVTMFFDLKSLADTSNDTRPSEFYQKNCIATLSINNPLVIFCDTKTREWIEPLRNSLSGAETYYIEKNITEYDYYKTNLSIVVNNRNVLQNYRNPNDRVTPSYFLTTIFKFYALQLASEIVKDATHYVWVDFGCQHVVWEADKRLQAVFDNPRPKVCATYIHYRATNDIKDVKRCLFTPGMCSIAAGLISVEKSYMHLFFTRAMSIFYEQLSLGVGHCEEQVLMYIYDRYPEMFTLVYGDYYSLISNYHYVVRDYPCIRHHFINNALKAGRKDLASGAAKNVLESNEKGLINLPADELAFLKSLIV